MSKLVYTTGGDDGALEQELRDSGRPEQLIHVCFDAWDFIIGLRCGTVVQFEHAEPHGGWVTLRNVVSLRRDGKDISPSGSVATWAQRGFAVRADEIVWIAEGSS